jgi:hypothetical protein
VTDASATLNRTAGRREFLMQDAIYLAVTFVFFAIALAYVHFCERVR